MEFLSKLMRKATKTENGWTYRGTEIEPFGKLGGVKIVYPNHYVITKGLDSAKVFIDRQRGGN